MAFIHVKLDVDYAADPKVIRAGANAELLYVRALALAKRLLSDGYIDAAHLPQLTLGMPGKPDRHAQALVKEGLWSTRAGGYQITSWSRHNPTREQIEAVRARKAEAGKEGAHSKWHTKEKPSHACDYCMSSGWLTNGTVPSPSQNAEWPYTETETYTEEETETTSAATAQQLQQGEAAAAAFDPTQGLGW